MDPADGRVVSNFITQALRGEPLTIYGDGTQTRSFCYVDDLIEGLVRLMASSEKMPVNIGNPGEFTMLELAQAVLARVPTQAGLVFKPLPQDDPRQRCPDIGRAVSILGWAPTVSLAAGLDMTIPWYADKLGLRNRSFDKVA
jgi:UDP-glucuronate decarboxylase